MIGVITLTVIVATARLGLAQNLVLCPSRVECTAPSSIRCIPGGASECGTGGICCGGGQLTNPGCCVPKPLGIPTVEHGHVYPKPEVATENGEPVSGVVEPTGETVDGQTSVETQKTPIKGRPPFEQRPTSGNESTESNGTTSAPEQMPAIDEYEPTEVLPSGAGRPPRRKGAPPPKESSTPPANETQSTDDTSEPGPAPAKKGRKARPDESTTTEEQQSATAGRPSEAGRPRGQASEGEAPFEDDASMTHP